MTLLNSLHTLGYENLRPIQEKIITALLDKHDVLAVLPTGGGKSLCYQLPSLHFPGITVVVSPLLALMRDQVQSLRKKGIAAATINSTLTEDDRRECEFALQEGKIRLLYLAPETALTSRFQELCQHIPLSHVSIDEAHCISQWGFDFRPEYRQLSTLIDKIAQHQPRPIVSAFTATATPHVAKDIVHSLKMQDPLRCILPFRRPNLALSVVPVQSEAEKRQVLLKQIQTWREESLGSALIYTATRQESEELCLWLKTHTQTNALAYHAGLSTSARLRKEEQFLHAPRQLMVATTAFGMGVDHPHIRLVIHHSPPISIEAYAQEVGRAGRDGAPAQGVLLYLPSDFARNFSLHTQHLPQPRIALLRQHAQRMVRFCEQHKCLSQYLEDTFVRPLHYRPQYHCHCGVCQPTRRVSQQTPLETQSAGILLQLKLRRKRIAEQKKIPPYFLGNDKLLRVLAEKMPQTWQELKTVAGMGHARLFYWGREILAVTQRSVTP